MKYLISIAMMLLAGAGCSTIRQEPEATLPINDSAGVIADIGAPTKEEPIEEPGELSASPDEEINELTTNTMSYSTIDGQNDLVAEFGRAVLKTNKGDIIVEFYADASPKTVNNFLNLAKKGFYNGTRFHRIIKDFMIQGGDPNSKDVNKKSMWGTGDPGYKFADEFNNYKLVKGSMAMANSGPNTNGSQFFIVTAPETPWLDGAHTNFGFVVDGMDVVDELGNVETGLRDAPVEDVIITSVELLKK